MGCDRLSSSSPYEATHALGLHSWPCLPSSPPEACPKHGRLSAEAWASTRGRRGAHHPLGRGLRPAWAAGNAAWGSTPLALVSSGCCVGPLASGLWWQQGGRATPLLAGHKRGGRGWVPQPPLTACPRDPGACCGPHLLKVPLPCGGWRAKGGSPEAEARPRQEEGRHGRPWGVPPGELCSMRVRSDHSDAHLCFCMINMHQQNMKLQRSHHSQRYHRLGNGRSAHRPWGPSPSIAAGMTEEQESVVPRFRGWRPTAMCWQARAQQAGAAPVRALPQPSSTRTEGSSGGSLSPRQGPGCGLGSARTCWPTAPLVPLMGPQH